MKFRKSAAIPVSRRAVVKTTFLDIIGRLFDTTNDDAAVVASVQRIFEECDVRLVRSLAPVQLVTKSLRRL